MDDRLIVALLEASNGGDATIAVAAAGKIVVVDGRIVDVRDAAASPLPPRRFSQRDPRWRDVEYAGGKTFGEAGCLVTCVAMVASQVYADVTPPDVAAKLREAGAFSGALLSRPDRIPRAFPLLEWGGKLDWRTVPADLGRLQLELERGPVIVEVDAKPGGEVQQHFVLATSLTDDGEDLIIIDPWDGAETRLLARYAAAHWNLARAVLGARLLRVSQR